MRIFIHTKNTSQEPSGTKVIRDINGNKTLKRPNNTNYDKPFDQKLLKYPIGSYVDKKGKIIHLCIIPKSKWYNPFKIQKTNSRGQVVDEFEEYLLNNNQLINDLKELDNYTEIGCWCTPKKCHGDTILKLWKQHHQQSKPCSNNTKNAKNPKKINRKRNRNTMMEEDDDDHNHKKYSRKKRKINDYFKNINTNNKDSEQKEEKEETKSVKIRLICISDTHNKHELLTTKLESMYESDDDILIHCGDMTSKGRKSELIKVNE